MHGDSHAWKSFTYASFAIALGLMLIGIWAIPVEIAFKAYLLMGTVFHHGVLLYPGQDIAR